MSINKTPVELCKLCSTPLTLSLAVNGYLKQLAKKGLVVTFDRVSIQITIMNRRITLDMPEYNSLSNYSLLPIDFWIDQIAKETEQTDQQVLEELYKRSVDDYPDPKYPLGFGLYTLAYALNAKVEFHNLVVARRRRNEEAEELLVVGHTKTTNYLATIMLIKGIIANLEQQVA